ncbi:hypothetical protein DB346_05950 [Verrucomicrobia bacterium LW23]|nr:hypothetical protein DB346_05950 [Verrucomicrobia bacterium LW23]
MAVPKSEYLDEVVEALRSALGGNLYSCCLYGSAVRGNFERDSDLNLLILLNDFTPSAHVALAAVISKHRRVAPFLLARRGFERSFRVFSPKFASIRRNYRVLAGADPLAAMRIDPEEERYLVEQALRNLRLRLVHAFVTRLDDATYQRHLVRIVTPLFVQLGEVARLSGVEQSKDFAERIPGFEKLFGIDGAVLTDLLELKAKASAAASTVAAPAAATAPSAEQWHSRLFPLIDAVVVWMEANWKAQLLPLPGTSSANS